MFDVWGALRRREAQPWTFGGLILGLLLAALSVAAEDNGPPAVGEGPYDRLVLRGVMVVDGTGAPPQGPMDLVIEEDEIVRIAYIGAPGTEIDPARRPEVGENGREIDLTGSWVLPGFVDLYGYAGRNRDYASRLWLAHGITTVREPVCERGMEICNEWRRAAEEHSVVSPRVVPWLHFGLGRPGLKVADADDARAWVREAKEQGAAGIKFRGEKPEIFAAALDEAEDLGLPTSCHHSPLWVSRTDVLFTARHGLDQLEHFYGLPEALIEDTTLPAYPADYNYLDEQHRFATLGRLWGQATRPGSERWQRVIAEMVEGGVAMVPTLALYEANRDLMRARQKEWHAEYTLPSLWQSFTPNRSSHAAHFFAWTTEDEVAWRKGYRRWMRFLRDYANAGGRVAIGTDAGFMYTVFGFAFVREMELLREAGFTPLEILRAATQEGADELGLADQIGTIEPGKRADLVVVPENPVADFKVLYGTGTPRLRDDGTLERIGGVTWTIRDGVLYDAQALRQEVRRMVKAEQEPAGK
ncbi:MAG: amidohydrolase family protein [Acidobacteriota bacterium]